MKVNLQSIYNTFFFLEDLTLIKGEGAKEVDLAGRSDAFLQAIILGISSGLLGSDKKSEELLPLVQNSYVKDGIKLFLGLPIEAKVEDVIEAPVEVIEVEVQEDAPEPVADEEEVKDESALLADLLVGSNKQVIAKIKNAGLNAEQKTALSEMEEKNKNRSAVLSAINEA